MVQGSFPMITFRPTATQFLPTTTFPASILQRFLRMGFCFVARMKVCGVCLCASAILLLHFAGPCLAVALAVPPQPFLCDYELAMQLRPFGCHGVVMRMIVDILRAQFDAQNLSCTGTLPASLMPQLSSLPIPRAHLAVFFHIGLAPRYAIAARRVYTALMHSGLAEVLCAVRCCAMGCVWVSPQIAVAGRSKY